jgi:hypothetical protein
MPHAPTERTSNVERRLPGLRDRGQNLCPDRIGKGCGRVPYPRSLTDAAGLRALFGAPCPWSFLPAATTNEQPYSRAAA